MSARDDNRMNFIALKIKSGVTLSPTEETYWQRHVHMGDKMRAGLPLTPEEAEKMERAKEAISTVRNGALWVEAPTMTGQQWKQHVAQSRGAMAKLVGDEIPHENKPQTQVP